MTFAQKPWDQMVPHFESYRSLYMQHHKAPPPPPVCVDFLCCHESAEKAELLAREYMSNYYVTVMQHYEMASAHFGQMKGYGDYAAPQLAASFDQFAEQGVGPEPTAAFTTIEEQAEAQAARAYLGEISAEEAVANIEGIVQQEALS